MGWTACPVCGAGASSAVGGTQGHPWAGDGEQGERNSITG